jgi:P-type conjugative transfer protein TrbJ
LEGDVRLLKSLDYSNLGELRSALNRLDSVAAGVDNFTAARDQLGELLERDWPTDWTGAPQDQSRFESARRGWIEQRRQTLVEVRAMQNAITLEMQPTRNRIAGIVEASNAAQGLTQALQARAQLHAELSSELSKLQLLRAVRAAMRNGRLPCEQSQDARARAVATWLSRTDGVIAPAAGQGTYAIEPIPESAGGNP